MNYFICIIYIPIYIFLYKNFQNLTTAFRQFDTDQDGVVTLHYEQFIGLVFSIKG